MKCRAQDVVSKLIPRYIMPHAWNQALKLGFERLSKNLTASLQVQ